MKAVLSHPIISSFLKHYSPSDHMNCLQAVSLIGISLLKGKFYTSAYRHGVSTKLSTSRLSLKCKAKPKIGSNTKRPSAKSVSQQKSLKGVFPNGNRKNKFSSAQGTWSCTGPVIKLQTRISCRQRTVMPIMIKLICANLRTQRSSWRFASIN